VFGKIQLFKKQKERESKNTSVLKIFFQFDKKSSYVLSEETNRCLNEAVDKTTSYERKNGSITGFIFHFEWVSYAG